MSGTNLEKMLLEALEDERKAEETYVSVIKAFGPVRPFINIVQAETRHSLAIERQLMRLGIPIPPNNWAGKIEPPASVSAACELAIQAEIENIALYDRLIPEITDRAVQKVFRNLQSASRENHLPAFRRCLERQGGGGGRGRGRGGGCRR